MCVRISRAIPNNKPTPATALSVHDNVNLMAVGFGDGSILLYRGEVYLIALIVEAMYVAEEGFCTNELFCGINCEKAYATA